MSLQGALREPSLECVPASVETLLQRPGVVEAVFQHAPSIEALGCPALDQSGSYNITMQRCG